jgi:putative phosphoribosyl transferase
MAQLHFRDRKEAGQRLAEVLGSRAFESPLVVALPRGGVPVAVEVALALSCPLDLVLVRKLGVPQQPELAFGAVVNGDNSETVLNKDIVRAARLDDAEIASVRDRELAEIERRRQLYFRGRPRQDPHDRTVIVVDDGVATGATARAALRALRRAEPKRLVLAVPLAPADTLESLRGEADEIVCLSTPRPFRGVGACYGTFPQLDDAEVVRLLGVAQTGPSEKPAAL